jgi:hypothetical protein
VTRLALSLLASIITCAEARLGMINADAIQKRYNFFINQKLRSKLLIITLIIDLSNNIQLNGLYKVLFDFIFLMSDLFEYN